MEAVKVESYNKYGCKFFGDLVVVDYLEDMKKDPKYGQWGAMVTFDYSEKAKQLVYDTYGDKFEVLLSIPELVVRLK